MHSPLNNSTSAGSIGTHQAFDALRTARQTSANELNAAGNVASNELRETFQEFVGQTFFAEMIKAARTTQKPAAYFHGGRAEEIFQGQLDQVLTEDLAKSSASTISDPMFELFMLRRQS